MYKLRNYQEIASQVGVEILTDKKGRREVIVAATSAGKSLIIASIVDRLPNDGNILVLQPSFELLMQNVSKIEAFGTVPAVYSASAKRKEFGRIIYATPKSCNYENFKDANIKYVIIDECEGATQSGSELVRFLKAIKVKSVLGLTGSPIYMKNTMEGSQLKIMTRVKGKFFTDICHVTQIQEMISLGYWSKLKYIEEDIDTSMLKYNSNGSDYTEQSILMSYEANDIEGKILETVSNIPKNESILIFAPSIQNVEELTKKIKGAVCVHSKTTKKLRDEYVEGFKSGKYQIMVNALALGIGFDYPDLRHLIDAYPTNSARIYIQRIGRLVRISKETGKEFGVVHDLANNVKKFGKVENINFENIEGYGWGMFSGNKLITGVPMDLNIETTKEELRKNKKSKKTYIFSEETTKGETKFTFGKYKDKLLKEVFEQDKGYLKWLINDKTGFDFSRNRELEKEIRKIFI